MERFSFSFHFSNNILCSRLLLVLFPDSRASCEQTNGNKEDIKFWALHTLQVFGLQSRSRWGKLHLTIMPHSFVHKFKL